MRGYGQYCPIARGAELLGDRWTLLIAREMLHGVCRFNELERCLPGISRSVLSQRLRHLQKLGLVERVSGETHGLVEYRLTAAGRDLRPVMQALGDWAVTWAFGDPDPDELDPDLVVRWISRHLARDRLPARRVVVAFEVLGRSTTRWYWLVIDTEEVSICRHDPGFPTDVAFCCDAETLYRVYLGDLSIGAAQHAGRLELTGDAAALQQAPGWFAWSTFAPAVRGAERRRAAATVRS
ncbi:winged helix-turn-helix transcriptional regulator [Nocardioides panacihumi]|uniref:Winged helix-turn-helix transcriptional regulator n=1 Tax=Nocardioides panacihumi TaxID=400774 RepID=A0ABP5BZR8_9ACTN